MIHLFLCICDVDNNLLRAGNTTNQFKMIHIEPLVFIFLYTGIIKCATS
jgi:hypothetical protein